MNVLQRRVGWLGMIVVAVDIAIGVGVGCGDPMHGAAVLADGVPRVVIPPPSTDEDANGRAEGGTLAYADGPEVHDGKLVDGPDATVRMDNRSIAPTEAGASTIMQVPQCTEGARRDCLVYRDNPDAQRGYRYCERGLQTCTNGSWGTCRLGGI